MSKFELDIAEVKADIAEDGLLCLWRQLTNAPPPDPDRPDQPGAAVPNDYNVHILFVPPGSSLPWLAYLLGTNIPTGAEIGIMGNYGFEPSLRDIVFKGPDENSPQISPVSPIDALAPDGTPILYTIRFVRT